MSGSPVHFSSIYLAFIRPAPKGGSDEEWERQLAPTGLGRISFVLLQLSSFMLTVLVACTQLQAHLGDRAWVTLLGLILGWPVAAFVASVLSLAVRVGI